MYSQLIPILAPIFIVALPGCGWARLAAPFNREFVTGIVMNVGVPCLILRGTAGLEADVPLFMSMIGYAVLALIVCATVGGAILRALGQPLRSYLPPVAFGNIGNLGLPLCLFAFGPRGQGLAIGFCLVGSVSQFLVGPPTSYMWSGLSQRYSKRISWLPSAVRSDGPGSSVSAAFSGIFSNRLRLRICRIS